MGMTIAEKILARNSGQARVRAGDLVTVRVDTAVLFDNNFMPSIWQEILKTDHPERVVVNVHCLYHEFRGIHSAPDFMEMSAKMLHYRNKLKAANVYPHSACHHGHEHCDGEH